MTCLLYRYLDLEEVMLMIIYFILIWVAKLSITIMIMALVFKRTFKKNT